MNLLNRSTNEKNSINILYFINNCYFRDNHLDFQIIGLRLTCILKTWSTNIKQKKTYQFSDLFSFTSWPRKGYFYYKISGSGGPNPHPGLDCSEFLASKVTELKGASFAVKNADVSICPPSANQLTDSLKPFTAAGIPSSMTCYAKRNALSSTATDERTPRCCYDNANKGLITDPSIANGFNTYM